MQMHGCETSIYSTNVEDEHYSACTKVEIVNCFVDGIDQPSDGPGHPSQTVQRRNGGYEQRFSIPLGQKLQACWPQPSRLCRYDRRNFLEHVAFVLEKLLKRKIRRSTWRGNILTTSHSRSQRAVEPVGWLPIRSNLTHARVEGGWEVDNPGCQESTRADEPFDCRTNHHIRLLPRLCHLKS